MLYNQLLTKLRCKCLMTINRRQHEVIMMRCTVQFKGPYGVTQGDIKLSNTLNNTASVLQCTVCNANNIPNSINNFSCSPEHLER